MTHLMGYGNRSSTNEKLTKFLEDAIRGGNDDDDGKSGKVKESWKDKKDKKTNRLSNLYGLNVQHTLVKERSNVSLPPMSLSPTARGTSQLQQELSLKDDNEHREHYANRQTSLNTNMRGMAGSYSNLNGQSIPTTESTLYSTKNKFVSDDADRRPWYLGQNNTASTTPGSAFAKVNRYGLNGALQMFDHERQMNSSASAPAIATLDLATSSHMNLDDPALDTKAQLAAIRDEYKPPLMAQAGTSGVNMNSPAQWPPEAAYTSGSKLKMSPVQTPEIEEVVGHNRDRTKPKARDESRIFRAHARESVELERLSRMLDREKDQLKTTSKLRSLSSTPTSAMLNPSQPRKRKEKRLKYWTNFTLIHSKADKSPSEIAEMVAGERDKAQQRYAMKWAGLKNITETMLLPQYRKPGVEDLFDLREALRRTASENPQPWMLSREQFVHILIAQYDKATLKQVNRVYSGFDVERSDMVDFRVIVGALRMFRKPTESVIYKMRDVVAMFTDDKSSNPTLTVSEIFKIFFVPVGSTYEKEEMFHEVCHTFPEIDNLGLSYALFEQMDKASAANDVGKESIYLTRLPLKTVLDALKQKRKNWNSITLKFEDFVTRRHEAASLRPQTGASLHSTGH